MKKIVIIMLVIIAISFIYILDNMEIVLLNTTITKNNIYTISKKIDQSNLSDELKTKIIMNLIIQNENCYGKKVKHLI